MGWFPELLAVGCGSEVHFYIVSDPCPFVYPVSQVQSQADEDGRTREGVPGGVRKSRSEVAGVCSTLAATLPFGHDILGVLAHFAATELAGRWSLQRDII